MMENRFNRRLHAIEEQIIHANGLMETLQQVACDNGAEISVMRSLDETMQNVTKEFYSLWSLIYPSKTDEH